MRGLGQVDLIGSRMNNLKNEVLDFGERARAAARALARMSTERKNDGLLAMADQLCGSVSVIMEANRKDVEKATARQLSLAMIDRLNSTKSAFRRWRMAFVKWLRSRTPLADALPNGPVRMGWSFQKCVFPSASSESSMSRVRT